MADYLLVLTFTAADDEQADRLGMAWAGTCAAEYGTRNPAVLAADPGDLPKRMAEAIRTAAHVCDDDCDVPGCHPNVTAVTESGGKIFDVEGTPEALVEVMMSVRWEHAAHMAARIAVAEAKVAEYENALNWQTSCLACSNVLDSSIAETERAEKAEAERDAAVAAVVTAHTNHIKEPHLDEYGRERRTGLHDPECSACRAFVALSAAVPARPDDPQELRRRLAQATTGETRDEYATCPECGREPIGNYPVAHAPSCSRMTLAPHLWPSPVSGQATTEETNDEH